MKTPLMIAIFLTVATASFAQEEPEKEKGFKKEKVFVGGNFGLSFGTYTVINVSPQIGYRFSDLFAAGLGINFQYVSIKERFNRELYRKTSQGVTGLNVFGRMYPIQRFMIQAQPEMNYVFGKEIYYQPQRQEYRLNAEIVPSLLLGGGLVIPSGRGAFITSVFYDVLQQENSPYGNRPILNFTVNVGL